VDDPIKTAKDGVALLGDILKAAGDNPSVKEAGLNLGKSALTITKTINNVMLPLAAVNFAFDKARQYFENKFQADMATKTGGIPELEIVEPKASIAGPALQGLAFSHEEPSLKDMYLSLLATAMDGRVAADAHPAFVEIIKQLASEEAELLPVILNTEGSLAIAEIRLNDLSQGGWHVKAAHLMNLRHRSTNVPFESGRRAAIVDNWVRLGLVEVEYGKALVGDQPYEWVEQRPEYIRFKAEFENEKFSLSFGRGVITRTALGLQFAKAAGLLSK
jgi:Abortive infection alpha